MERRYMGQMSLMEMTIECHFPLMSTTICPYDATGCDDEEKQ